MSLLASLSGAQTPTRTNGGGDEVRGDADIEAAHDFGDEFVGDSWEEFDTAGGFEGVDLRGGEVGWADEGDGAGGHGAGDFIEESEVEAVFVEGAGVAQDRPGEGGDVGGDGEGAIDDGGVVCRVDAIGDEADGAGDFAF